MAKRRPDVQVVAYRIDKAIEDGRAAVLPIFPSQNERSLLGKRPTMLILMRPLRLRLPPVRELDKARYQRKKGRPWDNRTTIPRSLLNCRWINVSSKSPDFEELSSLTPVQLQAVGIFNSPQGFKRRIYEVVEDLAHGQRQCVHVKDAYDPKITVLAETLVQIADRLSKSQSGLAEITTEELRVLNSDWAAISLRLVAIDHICQDRSGREASLTFLTQVSSAQLFARQASLANFTEAVKRTPRLNPGPREMYLKNLVTELGMYSAPEVKKDCNRACFLINQAASQLDEPQKAIAMLVVAAKVLGEAGTKLTQWAVGLEKKED